MHETRNPIKCDKWEVMRPYGSEALREYDVEVMNELMSDG
jgi:hypothetical protein